MPGQQRASQAEERHEQEVEVARDTAQVPKALQEQVRNL